MLTRLQKDALSSRRTGRGTRRRCLERKEKNASERNHVTRVGHRRRVTSECRPATLALPTSEAVVNGAALDTRLKPDSWAESVLINTCLSFARPPLSLPTQHAAIRRSCHCRIVAALRPALANSTPHASATSASVRKRRISTVYRFVIALFSAND